MKRAQNGTIWVDGRLRDWSAVGVPLMSDAVLRGLAVFDGMVADRQPTGLSLVAGQAHAERLAASARVLRLPLPYDEPEILAACLGTASAEAETTGADVVYVRPMVVGAELVEESRSGVSLTVAAFGQADVREADPVRVQVAASRRPPGDSIPPQVKAVTNYQLSRVTRLAARAAGYDDALLLNQHGRLAEAAGAAVLVETDRVLRTPPAWDDALESVTIRLLGRIADATGIPLEHDPVPLPSLYAARGAALAGTLSDVVAVAAVDDVTLPGGPLLDTLRGHFLDARRGGAHSELLEYWRG